MNYNFKGKKAIVFLGMYHHARRLMYMIDSMRPLGMEIKFVTSKNDIYLSSGGNGGCFELFLSDQNIDYEHLYSYKNDLFEANVKEKKQILNKKVFDNLKNKDWEMFNYIDPSRFSKAIEDAVETRVLFDNLLDKEKPDILFGLHEANFWVKIMSQAAFDKGIPVITFQEGFYTKTEARNEKYVVMAQYSKAALWGEEAKEAVLEKDKNAEDNIVLVGNSEYDPFLALTNEELDVLKKDSKKELKIDDNVDVLLLLMPYPYERFKESLQLEKLCEFVNELENTILLIKWHPREQVKLSQKMNSLINENKIKILFDIDIKKVIPASDICLTLDSTAGLDVLVFNKPLIELNFNQMNYGRSYSEEKVALLLDNISKLELITDILNNKCIAYDNKDRKKYLEKVLYKIDGRSSERVIDLVDKLIG